MTLLLQGLGVLLLMIGLLFMLGGTLGLIRLPDLYTRAHAASKCDTVGVGSLLLGLWLLGGWQITDLKLLLLIALILISGPTTAHALARSGYRTGLHPWRREPRPPTPEGGDG
jgi:monovalent cation/proton antiporter MnhG/PhaG subunit